MQERDAAKTPAKSVRNAMILVFLYGIINIVIACIEFVVFLPMSHWTITFVNVLIDFGLSIALLLMGLMIYKRNRWGWMGAMGMLGFLFLNQMAIATAVFSARSNIVWFSLLTLWVILQGLFLLYLLFNRRVRNEIMSAYRQD